MMATLLGKNRSAMQLEIGFPQPIGEGIEVWSLDVVVDLSGGRPRLNHELSSCLYQLPELDSLQRLIAGDNSASFQLEVQNFELEIVHHKLSTGLREGYLVHGHIFSDIEISNTREHSSEMDRKAADQLLRDNSVNALSIRFAFVIDFVNLTSFRNQLAEELMVRRS